MLLIDFSISDQNFVLKKYFSHSDPFGKALKVYFSRSDPYGITLVTFYLPVCASGFNRIGFVKNKLIYLLILNTFILCCFFLFIVIRMGITLME